MSPVPAIEGQPASVRASEESSPSGAAFERSEAPRLRALRTFPARTDSARSIRHWQLSDVTCNYITSWTLHFAYSIWSGGFLRSLCNPIGGRETNSIGGFLWDIERSISADRAGRSILACTHPPACLTGAQVKCLARHRSMSNMLGPIGSTRLQSTPLGSTRPRTHFRHQRGRGRERGAWRARAPPPARRPSCRATLNQRPFSASAN